MAPEQLRGQPATRSCDVFAAGIVMWEALTGERLFGGADSDAEVIGRVLSMTVKRPSEVAPEVPREFDRVVLRALDRDPAERYATAAEFSAAIEASGVSIASARAVSEYVQAVLAEPLAVRRDLLKRLRAQSSEGESAQPLSVEYEVLDETAMAVPARKPSRRWLAGVLAFVVVGSVASAIAWRRGLSNRAWALVAHDSPATTQVRAPVQAPPALAPSVPQPPIEQASETPPAAPPAVPAADPVVEQPAIAASPRPRTRRSAHTRRSTHHAADPSQHRPASPTPPASTSTQEYRPGDVFH
jgi:serine/threonine-protein kinase